MKKILIINQKGGVGKTTTAVNLAAVLEKEYNKKVLVIDCDEQMNCSNYLLTDSNQPINTSLADYLKSGSKNIIYKVSLDLKDNTYETNVDIIPSSQEINNINLSDRYVLRKLLSSLDKDYDFCIIDCPPHLSKLTICAMIAGDYIIVPSLADTDSLGGYDLLISAVNDIRRSDNSNLSILGVLFCNVEKTKALDTHIINSSIENMRDNVFKTTISRASVVSQARFFGKPLVYYKPRSKPAQDYIEFTKEVLKKTKRRK